MSRSCLGSGLLLLMIMSRCCCRRAPIPETRREIRRACVSGFTKRAGHTVNTFTQCDPESLPASLMTRFCGPLCSEWFLHNRISIPLADLDLFSLSLLFAGLFFLSVPLFCHHQVRAAVLEGLSAQCVHFTAKPIYFACSLTELLSVACSSVP